jgi:hypothetical protein
VEYNIILIHIYDDKQPLTEYMMNSRLVFPDFILELALHPYNLNSHLNMSNVHGFGDFGGPRNNPNNNNPPRRGGQQGPPPPDDDGPGFLGGFQEPILEDQLRVADQHRVLFVSGRKSLKDPR